MVVQCPNILNFAPSSSNSIERWVDKKKFSSSPQVFQASFQKLGAPPDNSCTNFTSVYADLAFTRYTICDHVNSALHLKNNNLGLHGPRCMQIPLKLDNSIKNFQEGIYLEQYKKYCKSIQILFEILLEGIFNANINGGMFI